MPPTTSQRPYFATFRQRVASTMKASTPAYRGFSNSEAEQLVWQQLEAELLQLSSLAALE